MANKQALQLGNRLSLLRKRKSMTLDELSAKSGVSKSILSQIERDLSKPIPLFPLRLVLLALSKDVL